MHYLLILLVAMPLWAVSQKEISSAQKSIKALIRPLVPGNAKERPKGTEKFRVDGCSEQKVDWMDVLTMKKVVTLSYRFSPGCDIEGDIKPKVLAPFHAELKLRNLDSYTKVASENKVTASLESRPIMFLEMTEGVLTGRKGKVKFEADYRVRIDPMAPKDPISENIGGEIRIKEIFGEKVSIKEKIYLK